VVLWWLGWGSRIAVGGGRPRYSPRSGWRMSLVESMAIGVCGGLEEWWSWINYRDAASWRWRRGFATLHPQSAPGLAACCLLLGGRCSAAAQRFCPTVILAGTSRSEELSGGWAMLRSPVADTERPPRSWSLRIHPIRNRFPTCSRRQRSPASSSVVSGAADRRICEQYHRLVLRG